MPRPPAGPALPDVSGRAPTWGSRRSTASRPMAPASSSPAARTSLGTAPARGSDRAIRSRSAGTRERISSSWDERSGSARGVRGGGGSAMTERDRDLEQMLARMSRTRVSRRGFLAGTGLAGLSAFIAACAGTSATTSPTTQPSTGPAPSAAPVASAAESAAASVRPSAVAVTETEGKLFMYNWADYVDPDNIEKFKKDFKVDEFTYDIFSSNEEMMTKLQGGAVGQWDIGAPTAEFVEAMVAGKFIDKLDWSKIPNAAFIDPQFQNFYKGDKAFLNDYHLPKDWGTTGSALRTKDVKEDVKTWKDFFDVAPKYSGRIVVVNSP